MSKPSTKKVLYAGILSICSVLLLLFLLSPVVERQHRIENKTEKEALAIINANSRLKKLFDFSKANLHGIEFVGKVVDQNEDPVQGVRILCDAGGGPLGGGSGYIRLTTDEQGFFQITGKEGDSLQIQKMVRNGYQIALQQQNVIFYSFKKFPHSLIWTDYTKSNPYVYKAWKISPDFKNRSELIRKQCRGYLKTDGTVNVVDLFSRGRKKISPNNVKGQLSLSFVRPNVGNEYRKRKSNWQLKLTALEGGVMKAESLYTNLAPEKGYSKSTIFTSDGYPEGEGRIFENIYLTINEGRQFARLTLILEPYNWAEQSSYKIAYTINPEGERFLDTFDGFNYLQY